MTADPRPGNTVQVTRPGRWNGTVGRVTLSVLSNHTDLWTHVIDTAPTATFYTDELRPTS